MIRLTRLRQETSFYLNPDLFERVDEHVDTVIKLTDGAEYVVVESAEEIVRRIVEFRAQVIALAGVLPSTASDAAGAAYASVGHPAELTVGDAPWDGADREEPS